MQHLLEDGLAEVVQEPWLDRLWFFLLGLNEELRLYGQNSRYESFESENKRSRWAGNKRCVTACTARCGMTGHTLGHGWCTCGNLLIVLITICGKL
jgi:hypothetical protein